MRVCCTASFLREKFFLEEFFFIHNGDISFPFYKIPLRVLCKKKWMISIQGFKLFHTRDKYWRGGRGDFRERRVLGGEGRMRTDGALAVAARMRPRNTTSLSQFSHWPSYPVHLTALRCVPPSLPLPPRPSVATLHHPFHSSPSFRSAGSRASPVSCSSSPLLFLALFIWAQRRRCRCRVVSSLYPYAVSPLLLPHWALYTGGLFTWSLNACVPRKLSYVLRLSFFLLALTFFFTYY